MPHSIYLAKCLYRYFCIVNNMRIWEFGYIDKFQIEILVLCFSLTKKHYVEHCTWWNLEMLLFCICLCAYVTIFGQVFFQSPVNNVLLICIYKLHMGYVSKENSISLLCLFSNETVHNNLQIFGDSPFSSKEWMKLFYKRMILRFTYITYTLPQQNSVIISPMVFGSKSCYAPKLRLIPFRASF